MINYTELNTNMNTDELCEAYFSFLTFNGLEAMEDVSADEMLYHIRSNSDQEKETEEAKWLKRFMLCWWEACDIESNSCGHAIEPFHGWQPEMTQEELEKKAQF